MTPHLILATAIAAIGFASGWQIQSWRYGAKETQRVQQALLETQQAAARDIRRTDNAIAAQNQAVLRERSLRAAADGSRAALVGLSLAADAALRRAQDTHASCLVTAASQNLVLNQCGERYRDLAEIADRHASDLEKIIDSRPK